MIVRRLVFGTVALLLLAAAAYVALQVADRPQVNGSMRLASLTAPVRVVRDEQGIAYVHAATLDDAIRAQGFLTAQDRLLQIEFERYLAAGRLAELVGESALAADIVIRLAGTERHGRRHAALLAPADRRFFELYLEGMNAYIREQAADHQLGFGLLRIKPQPWTLADMMTLLYFLNWSSSVNLRAELLTQELIERLGAARAAEIGQVTVNPDDGSGTGPGFGAPPTALAAATVLGGLRLSAVWRQSGPQPLEVGSNQWVTSGARSRSGAPVVVNDTHLDARQLPGVWHPIGLITPAFRAVGVAGPGIPGLAAGRTSHIAWGITNAKGDNVDLFLETVDPRDPGRYLEGAQSHAFEVVREVLRVRSRPGSTEFREVPLTIRYTHRGPVISDHGVQSGPGLLISMRWGAPEAMTADIGAAALLTARSVSEARAALTHSTAPYNYVLADTAGNIAHVTTGRVPIRRHGDGSTPQAVRDGEDAWLGFIPAAEMPGSLNPSRGWVGNANHRTVPGNYPYAYSTDLAASWRYRRMRELLDGDGVLEPAQHWAFMRDVKNVMAAQVAPLMSQALRADADTQALAGILARWDHQDQPEAAAPLIFQAVFRHFAVRVYRDELGEDLATRLVDFWYYSQERLVRMLEDPSASWFDDIATPGRETRDDLFVLAAKDALAELVPQLGPDPTSWRWGDLHTLSFFSPLLPGDFGARLLGDGVHPKEGSGETLNRATYRLGQPYSTVSIAALRFVADLGDPDKVLAVVTGGASGRQFDRHLADQSPAWRSGEPRYWWFSDAAIAAHAQSELELTP